MQLFITSHFIRFISSFSIHVHTGNTKNTINKHIYYKWEFKLSSISKQALGISKELEFSLSPMFWLILGLKQQELQESTNNS